MLPLFLMRSGIRRVLPASIVAVLALVVSGCFYSFTGGGLPRHIRTIAVLPFENVTAQTVLTSDLQRELQEQLPRNLGVRLADERTADAVVRGRIASYDEPPPVSRPAQPGERVTVVQQQVRITVEAEIYDMREDRPIWQARSLSVTGNFQPDRGEQFTTGQQRAIQELVQRVIEGAQSQW